MIGAIETYHAGCLFRSRLEARWAVFFQKAGIAWKYEDQGYEVGEHRYLPDFHLPELNLFAEVKGDPDGLRSEFARMSAIMGPKSPLPGFQDGSSKLIVLGNPPEVSYGVTVLHPTFTRASGILQRTWGYFAALKTGGCKYLADNEQSVLSVLFSKYAFRDPSESPDSLAWDVDPWVMDTPGSFENILDAYKAARQARFEHGANGR